VLLLLLFSREKPDLSLAFGLSLSHKGTGKSLKARQLALLL